MSRLSTTLLVIGVGHAAALDKAADGCPAIKTKLDASATPLAIKKDPHAEYYCKVTKGAAGVPVDNYFQMNANKVGDEIDAIDDTKSTLKGPGVAKNYEIQAALGATKLKSGDNELDGDALTAFKADYSKSAYVPAAEINAKALDTLPKQGEGKCVESTHEAKLVGKIEFTKMTFTKGAAEVNCYRQLPADFKLIEPAAAPEVECIKISSGDGEGLFQPKDTTDKKVFYKEEGDCKTQKKDAQVDKDGNAITADAAAGGGGGNAGAGEDEFWKCPCGYGFMILYAVLVLAIGAAFYFMKGQGSGEDDDDDDDEE